MKSATLIVMGERQENANRLACSMGWDRLPGDTFSVPLSPSGKAPATHYACHAWVTDGFVETIAQAREDVLPPIDFGKFGLTANDVHSVIDSLIDHIVDGGDPMVNFQAALASAGLKRIEESV